MRASPTLFSGLNQGPSTSLVNPFIDELTCQRQQECYLSYCQMLLFIYWGWCQQKAAYLCDVIENDLLVLSKLIHFTMDGQMCTLAILAAEGSLMQELM